jgi:hypothetical protein
MNKKILIAVILLFIICFGAIYLNRNVLSEKSSKDISAEESTVAEENDFLKYIDYPLLDEYFLGNDDWIFVIDDGTEDDKCKVITDKNVLETVKTEIVLNTFPVGRGTSPEGRVCLYRNGELIKNVPYIKITYTIEDFFEKTQASDYSRGEIEKMYNITLPDLY